MNPDAARQMLISSDYPMDKVVYRHEDSIDVPAGTLTDSIDIPHDLTFVPAPILVWSNTPDFSVTYTGGDAQLYSGQIIGSALAGQEYNASATSTNVIINLYNNSGSDQTVYYRVIALAPSSAPDSSVVPFTENADDFVINTDFNYMKLYNTGRLTTDPDNEYSHNLSYTPRVWVWNDILDGDIIAPYIATSFINLPTIGPLTSSIGVYATENDLIWEEPGSYTGIPYRIYLDG